MWQEKKAAPARKENMRYRIYSASSLTDSLRSVVRLRRAVPAYWWGGKFLEDTWKILSGTERRPRRSRFSIGSAPLTSITKSDAQISGGETRQDLKIPGVSPGGSLVRSPVPAFRFTGVTPLLWPRFLIPRLTLSSGKAVRSKLDCMHEPPVQSDRCAFSGNYRLESNPERHD